MVKGRPKPTPANAPAEVVFDPSAAGARKPRRAGALSLAIGEWHNFMIESSQDIQTMEIEPSGKRVHENPSNSNKWLQTEKDYMIQALLIRTYVSSIYLGHFKAGAEATLTA
ncbi:hypothetical protein E2562_038045 [Oryza meyeriana var. granulata]|uniref:Uncharacterized protein n=1 Tax=Oryza meyeriana var. granulata TaxID=110450 RepID=A0A6G1EU09_9ORYZ|nr:hypothetical protein E2562_038045 [Oryza meyeriana var. granulata]KAF0928138.1 hypothetical protein E2562_038045 [Oryza meyeriana var. granulata]